MAIKATVTLTIGTLYLIGAVLLLPGFMWIIPTGVDYSKNAKGVPVFGPMYEQAVEILIAGMCFVLTAALADLILVHCKPHDARDVTAGPPLGVCSRVCGPVCQVLGALAILSGCVVYLPQFSLASPPVKIMGIIAPIIGSMLFLLGAIFYFTGAVLAVRGMNKGIRAASEAGRSAWKLRMQRPAFYLFMCCSTLYFANGLMLPPQAILAGWMRMGGTICLFSAVVLLYISELMDVCGVQSEGATSGGATSLVQTA